MRIVIDLQGAQGVNSMRGIGRASLSLAKAMVQHCGKHEIIIVLNALFPEAVEFIRSTFDGLLPQKQIRVWRAPGPVNYIDSKNIWRRKAAEFLREAFIASLSADVVFICSFFEGLSDDVVTSIDLFNSGIPTVVLLYDLIPLIYRETYLKNRSVAKWYDAKIAQLKRSSYLLSISESSRQKGIEYLGFSPGRIVNISAAAALHFCQRQYSSEEQTELRERYGLWSNYIMYTGGIDFRKNIEGLIRAYSRLSLDLRELNQLVIVCAIQDVEKIRLKYFISQLGLKLNEVLLTGFVPEEDLIQLYNMAKVFIFPSTDEGFGLPALEAMCCGCAVIGSNIDSLKEVIGCEEALFNPQDERSITSKLEQVLIDDNFRQYLEKHALLQAKKFSWEKTGKCAIAALEVLQSNQIEKNTFEGDKFEKKFRLAYISPLPPEQSGISDYSTALLPELFRYYDIDVVTGQEEISNDWINTHCKVRTIVWFEKYASSYDRILYHFGNSMFHQHMFDLLGKFPGVVVLHDFFLSGALSHMDMHGFYQGCWTRELYRSHGYQAIWHNSFTKNTADTIWKYPSNFSVFQNSLGVIVHSEYSCQLAKSWYGSNVSDMLTKIPLIIPASGYFDKKKVRKRLGISENEFLVCSFGILGLTKLNNRLLDAWLGSRLSKDTNCQLIFVGQNDNSEYCQDLVRKINQKGMDTRIKVTGWLNSEIFSNYMIAADIAVQLRTLSRGETSACVLNCMNFGLPTIVNANGSMSELPEDSIYRLPDNFSDSELITGLENLWENPFQRAYLGKQAQKTICTEHSVAACTDKYVKAIEGYYKKNVHPLSSLIENISQIEEGSLVDTDSLQELACAIDQSVVRTPFRRQLFIDISELVQRDVKTGIQRVVRAILYELLINSPKEYIVEPVFSTAETNGYFYARKFTKNFLNLPQDILHDESISYNAGDLFLGLDLQPDVVLKQRAFFQELRLFGVKVNFLVYDLLCISMPQHFFLGAQEKYKKWLEVVVENNKAICISKAVKNELDIWLKNSNVNYSGILQTSYFHLGADIENSDLSEGLPSEADSLLEEFSSNISFLVVGTLEPRKGHVQVLRAFSKLWEKTIDVNLIFSGKRGWKMEDQIIEISNHRELNNRFFWLENVNDEYLEKLYTTSTCLIVASEGEGFGLPLIEAARYKLPIIARSLPVFQEIADSFAFYFKNDNDPKILADSIEKWLNLFKKNQHPKSDNMPYLSWKKSAFQLKNILFENDVLTEINLEKIGETSNV